MASVLVVGLLALLSLTLALLADQASWQIRRTRHQLEQVQLRQLLLAGAWICQHTDTSAAWEIRLPAALSQQGFASTPVWDEHVGPRTVSIQARHHTRRLQQRLTFPAEPDAPPLCEWLD